MDSIEFFAFIVGVFLVGLAAFAAALYLHSRKARHDFAGANSRLSEVGYYLNEFSKAAAALREKAGAKATAAFVERKLVHVAKEIEEEKEFERERQERHRLVAVRLARKKKEKEKN